MVFADFDVHGLRGLKVLPTITQSATAASSLALSYPPTDLSCLGLRHGPDHLQRFLADMRALYRHVFGGTWQFLVTNLLLYESATRNTMHILHRSSLQVNHPGASTLVQTEL